MKQRKYSEKQRANAVELGLRYGPAEASRKTGIPTGTIKSWMSKAGKKSKGSEKTKAATEAAKSKNDAKREKLKALALDSAIRSYELMEEEQVDFKGQQADRVVYPRPPAQDRRALAMAAAVATDKFLLLNGEATGRNEHTGKDGAPLIPLSLTDLAERAAARKEAKDGGG